MSFELREHTADVAVAAEGIDLGAAFAAVANGLTAAMCETVSENAGGERFEIAVRAEGREALLYDYLDELIYQRDVRGVLPVANNATVERTSAAVGNVDDGDREAEWTVTASARGVPLGTITAREVKAVTYSEMELEESSEGWRAYVVFDV